MALSFFDRIHFFRSISELYLSILSHLRSFNLFDSSISLFAKEKINVAVAIYNEHVCLKYDFQATDFNADEQMFFRMNYYRQRRSHDPPPQKLLSHDVEGSFFLQNKH